MSAQEKLLKFRKDNKVKPNFGAMAQMLQARFGAALALSALLLAAVFMMQPHTPPRLTTSLLESFLGALEEYNTSSQGGVKGGVKFKIWRSGIRKIDRFIYS